MRLGKYAFLTIIYLLAILTATEMLSRVILRLKPLEYSRSYDPLFVSGDFVGEASRESLLLTATNRPAINNYTPTWFGNFIWNGQSAPRSSVNLTDFLFSHSLSLYSSREMDSILCSNPSSLSIFVLGSSVAQGSSASSKLKTWHALLESKLRHALARNDVYVFNGAMGAFLSTQERLAYDFAVSLRNPKVVIILNGANDLLLPASSGTRPGDPFQLGTRYNQIYNNPFTIWIAEMSAVFNYLLQADLSRSIVQLRSRLFQDDDAFSVYRESVVSIYMENMTANQRDCEAHGVACLVAVQPLKLLSETKLGISNDDSNILHSSRVVQLYELLWKAIHASRYSSHFMDLTGIVKSPTELAYYTDAGHFDDRGQMLIADALLPVTLGLANRAGVTRDSNDFCDRRLRN